MKKEKHVITNDEVREAELKRSTLELFRECGTHIAFIENHPILRDHTYTEILKDSRGAFKQALAGRRVIGSDLYEANAEIVFALMHLKSQREMLERLLAQTDADDHAELKQGIKDASKKLDAIGADAKRGADAAERAADMLADWRAWVDGGCRGRNGKSPMLNEMRQAIIDAWEKYSSGDADVELPDGTLRSKKRSRDEFYEAYANRIVYTSTADGKMWTLKQLCPKKDKLKTIIETGMRKRSRDNKPRKKKNGHGKI